MPVSVKPRKNLVACRQSDVVPLPEEEAHEKTGIILDQTLTDCDKAKAKHAYRKPKLSESSPISIPPSTQLEKVQKVWKDGQIRMRNALHGV